MPAKPFNHRSRNDNQNDKCPMNQTEYYMFAHPDHQLNSQKQGSITLKIQNFRTDLNTFLQGKVRVNKTSLQLQWDAIEVLTRPSTRVESKYEFYMFIAHNK